MSAIENDRFSSRLSHWLGGVDNITVDPAGAAYRIWRRKSDGTDVGRKLTAISLSELLDKLDAAEAAKRAADTPDEQIRRAEAEFKRLKDAKRAEETARRLATDPYEVERAVRAAAAQTILPTPDDIRAEAAAMVAEGWRPPARRRCLNNCGTGIRNWPCDCTKSKSGEYNRQPPRADCEKCAGAGEYLHRCGVCRGHGYATGAPRLTVTSEVTGRTADVVLDAARLIADGLVDIVRDDRRDATEYRYSLRPLLAGIGLTGDLGEYLAVAGRDAVVASSVVGYTFIARWRKYVETKYLPEHDKPIPTARELIEELQSDIAGSYGYWFWINSPDPGRGYDDDWLTEERGRQLLADLGVTRDENGITNGRVVTLRPRPLLVNSINELTEAAAEHGFGIVFHRYGGWGEPDDLRLTLFDLTTRAYGESIGSWCWTETIETARLRLADLVEKSAAKHDRALAESRDNQAG